MSGYLPRLAVNSLRTRIARRQAMYAQVPRSIACEPGFYQPNSQQTTCETCLQGFYCPFYGMTSNDLQECPIGSYCLSGSKIRKACPTGTFGNETQQISKNAACHNCLEGYYCDSEGLTESNMKTSNRDKFWWVNGRFLQHESHERKY